MEIHRLNGLDDRLYRMVAHLVMNEKVIAYNMNYPYKTSPDHSWFIAVDEASETIGFVPVKIKAKKATINNYYVVGDDEEVLSAIVAKIVAVSESLNLEAVIQSRHEDVFKRWGFEPVIFWKRYIKMTISKDEEERI